MPWIYVVFEMNPTSVWQYLILKSFLLQKLFYISNLRFYGIVSQKSLGWNLGLNMEMGTHNEKKRGGYT